MSSVALPPPNVGPEPAGLLQSVKEKIFGAAPEAPPDPYALTPAAAVQLLKDVRATCEPGRELFEYAWWRNILYYLNRQWIYWNPTTRQWNDKRLAKWVPKPVTNMIRTTVLSIRATAASIQLSTTVRPNGNEPENMLAAQTADDLEPSIAEEHEMEKQMQIGDFWAILLGNAFFRIVWDQQDPSHQAQVPVETCALCGQDSTPDQIVAAGQKCPGCGGNALRPKIDPATNQPAMKTVPIGKGSTYACSPLELLLPIYAQSFDQVDRLVWLTWRPKHEIEDELGPDQVKALKITWDKGPQTRSLQLFKAISTTSDLTVSPATWNTGAYTGQVEGTTEQHLWIKPCKQFPNGFYMRFFGEGTPAPYFETNDDGTPAKPEIPYKSVDGQPLWPWVHYPYEPIGGRLYAQGACDPVIQKQDQINQGDSMVQLSVQRMGNPIWLEPKGAAVERYTGEPGIVVRWQPVGANSAKPERIGGENPPQAFFMLREQYKADLEEMAGTYDILKGAQPSGVEAFSALQLLVERSQSRFTTFFKSRGQAYRQWYEIALELERAYGPTERVRAVMGPNNTWNFQTFQKANLKGNVTVMVEDGSNVPKTALGRRAAIEHGRQLGVVNPANGEQSYKVLGELGISDLNPSMDSDVKSALQEQQATEKWAQAGYQGPPPLQRMPWHNDEVHLQENRKWMNSDAVRGMIERAPKQIQGLLVQALGAHLQEHAASLQQMQAAQQPPQPQHGKPGEPQGAARAAANSNQESGKPGVPHSGAPAPGGASAPAA